MSARRPLLDLAALASVAVFAVALALCVALAYHGASSTSHQSVFSCPRCLAAALGLAGLGVAALWRALWAVYRALSASRAAVGRFDRIDAGAPSKLLQVASELGADASRLRVIDTPELVSFVVGLVRPRIVVSRGLVERLDVDELRAVVAHELYHARALDPLLGLAAYAAAAAFFFLPAVDALRDRYLAARELAADHAAVSRSGRAALVRALLANLDAPGAVTHAPSASFADSTLLEARLAQLEHRRPAASPPGLVGALGSSLLAAITVGVVTCSALAAVLGPPASPGSVQALTEILGAPLVCALTTTAGAVAAIVLTYSAVTRQTPWAGPSRP